MRIEDEGAALNVEVDGDARSAPLARPDWLPGALIASALVTFGYGWFIYTGNITTIWSMFGIANQALAILALALVTTWLVNRGRGRYALVTILPMLFVMSTTFSAATILVKRAGSPRKPSTSQLSRLNAASRSQ